MRLSSFSPSSSSPSLSSSSFSSSNSTLPSSSSFSFSSSSSPGSPAPAPAPAVAAAVATTTAKAPPLAPLPSLVCVEYPGYVQNTKRAIATLGGTQALEKYLKEFHDKSSKEKSYNVPVSVPLCYDLVDLPTGRLSGDISSINDSFVLKIMRKIRKRDPHAVPIYDAEMVGKVNEVVSFNGLADFFMHAPLHSTEDPSSRLFGNRDVYKENHWKSHPLVPHVFTPYDYIRNYNMDPVETAAQKKIGAPEVPGGAGAGEVAGPVAATAMGASTAAAVPVAGSAAEAGVGAEVGLPVIHGTVSADSASLASGSAAPAASVLKMSPPSAAIVPAPAPRMFPVPPLTTLPVEKSLSYFQSRVPRKYHWTPTSWPGVCEGSTPIPQEASGLIRGRYYHPEFRAIIERLFAVQDIWSSPIMVHTARCIVARLNKKKQEMMDSQAAQTQSKAARNAPTATISTHTAISTTITSGMSTQDDNALAFTDKDLARYGFDDAFVAAYSGKLLLDPLLEKRETLLSLSARNVRLHARCYAYLFSKGPWMKVWIKFGVRHASG